MISRKSAVLLAAALLLAACDHATAPSSVTEGMIAFVDRNFSGEFKQFTGDVKDLEDVRGCFRSDAAGNQMYDWGDCISSMRVAPGWTVTLYEDDHYGGQSRTITYDVANLKNLTGPCGDDWDDCVSSFRVSPP